VVRLKGQRMMRTWILGVLLVSLVLNGCAKQVEQQEQSLQPAQKVIYTIADPVGDWGFPTPWGHYQRGPGYIRMSLIYDTLIWKDDKGYIPALASNWKYDQESKTFHFILNEGMVWHDGEKLTAQDVVFTFAYMKKHPYPWVNLESIEKVEAESDTLVRITLKSEFAPFLANIAATLPIIPKHIWEKVQEPKKYTTAKAAIGSGPFQFADYNKGQGTYLYKANENYYGGNVSVDEVHFTKLNPQMAVAALNKEEVDAVAIQPEMATLLKEKANVISETGSSNVKLTFNHQKDPFSSKEFRQAIAYAIDTQELVDKAERGYGQEGNSGFYATDNKWYTPDAITYEYDLEEVENRMMKLGYVREAVQTEKESSYWLKDDQKVELELLCDADLSRVAEVLQEQLEKAGFSITIRSVESKTRDAKIAAWDFDMALNMHGGLGGDPQLLNKFILVDDFNSARYDRNQELNELLQRQVTMMGEPGRMEVVGEIQKLYAEEVPALTLYYPQNYWAHSGKIPLFYTAEGMAIGIPLPLNKISFIQGR